MGTKGHPPQLEDCVKAVANLEDSPRTPRPPHDGRGGRRELQSPTTAFSWSSEVRDNCSLHCAGHRVSCSLPNASVTLRHPVPRTVSFSQSLVLSYTFPQSIEMNPVAMAVHCGVRNWRQAAASES
ncbi:hypothetical protein E1301_Tti013035 [Triplophysa tibetana]|uniref:Uncharacterized protein n=1 Tax=Triplophysa tibetana TaxID=1572043 RepID=A0A5A9NKQ4_9TELE|nr:hypothetical protein E1301_Tti013035 [Triplophysa tibetana]